MKRWVSWYRSTDILYRGKDRVARGQTPPLSVMLPSPLSLFSLPGFGGDYPDPDGICISKSPSQSMSDICHMKKVMKGKPNDNWDKIFQTALSI